MLNMPIPQINYDFVPRDGHNDFRNKFGALPDEEWCGLLQRSVGEPVIAGVQFPRFPEAELQNAIHGNQGDVALGEACRFYSFVKQNTYGHPGISTGKRILDFGSGWGRIIRPFMRDFEFKDLFGFEPNFLLLALSRILNPYVTFLAGSYVPNESLPRQYFDLVIGWSVFSHLSQTSATMWLSELSRAVVPGGWCVLTTWGDRFLNRLQQEAVQREAGKEIHWYSAVCLDAAGPLKQQMARYENGDFVWFTSGQSTLYGEAFLSEKALRKLISQNELPFEVVVFDKQQLSQDAFVLKRL